MEDKSNMEITDKELEKINRYAVKPLKREDVYLFSVVLCDNEIDRDCEKFSEQALRELAPMYEGRTGIFDHDPKGENQSARIYETEVKTYDDRMTSDGKKYCALTGKAYMVRTESNKSLIAEIDGGIKKEVSVGCQIKSRICSICGTDINVSSCAHVKGRYYGEKLCFHILENPTDAYEWSFVAVPAQRNAGVTKTCKGGNTFLQGNYEERKKLALACENLREDIIKLSYFAKPLKSAESVFKMTEDMNFDELLKLKKALEKETSETTVSQDSFITEDISENNDNYRI